MMVLIFWFDIKSDDGFQEHYDDLFRKRAGIVPAVIYLDHFFFTGHKNRREEKKERKMYVAPFVHHREKWWNLHFIIETYVLNLGIWTRFNIFLLSYIHERISVYL